MLDEIKRDVSKQMSMLDLRGITTRQKTSMEDIFYSARLDRRSAEVYIDNVDVIVRKIENEYFDYLNERIQEMDNIVRVVNDPKRQLDELGNVVDNMSMYIRSKSDVWEDKYMAFDYYRPFQKMAEYDRRYEDVVFELRRVNKSFLIRLEDEIGMNLKQIQNNTKRELDYQYSQNMQQPEELEKSETPVFSEIIGINYDSKNNLYWMEINGKQTPLQFGFGEKKMNLPNGEAIAMKDETAITEFYKYKNNSPVELMKIDRASGMYLYVNNMNNSGFSINFAEQKIIIKNQDGSMESITYSDLNQDEMSDLVEKLTSICPNENAKDYFYRAFSAKQTEISL